MVFTSEDADTGALERALEGAIGERLGVWPRVVVLTCAELARVVANNPFPGVDNPRFLHAIFRSVPLDPGEVEAVAAAERRASERGGRDRARVVGTTLYLHTPDGFGRSELAAELTRVGGDRKDGTARNWATVRRLLAMCEG